MKAKRKTELRDGIQFILLIRVARFLKAGLSDFSEIVESGLCCPNDMNSYFLQNLVL